MTIKELAVLHKQVVHDRKYTEYALLLEQRWIKRYPYDALNSICSECFSEPDRFVTPADSIVVDL